MREAELMKAEKQVWRQNQVRMPVTELTKAKKKAHSRAYSKTKSDKLREGYGMDALTPFKL